MKALTEVLLDAAHAIVQSFLLTLPVAKLELSHILCCSVHCPDVCVPCHFKHELVCSVQAGYPRISDAEVYPRMAG